MLVYGTTTVDGASSDPGLTDGARLELHAASTWTASTIEGGDGTAVVNHATMTLDGGVKFSATAGAGIDTLADTRRGLQRKGGQQRSRLFSLN